eukprot:9500008-Pyramimonas_sp.AAC.1
MHTDDTDNTDDTDDKVIKRKLPLSQPTRRPQLEPLSTNGRPNRTHASPSVARARVRVTKQGSFESRIIIKPELSESLVFALRPRCC